MDTSQMTRAEKEVLFLGPPRFIIRITDEETGRVVNRVKTKELPRVRRGTKLGDVVLFTAQADGTFWMASLGLVRDIQEERQNYYGDWVLQKIHDPQSL